MDLSDRLKHSVGLFAFAMRLENLVHEHKPPDFPRISTKGHFDVVYPGKRPRDVDLNAYPLTVPAELFGALGEVRLRDGVGEREYRSEGDAIPGWDDGASPEEILVFAHGWLADDEGSLGRLSMMRYTLEHHGYPHPVVGFTWDTGQRPVEWRHGVEVGARNGVKLAQFLHDYRTENPDTRIRLVSNSLGSEPLFEALRALDAAGLEDVVSTSVTMGAATPSESVARGGRYGDAIANATRAHHNFWLSHDGTLNALYRNVEGHDAVGGTGAIGETPGNYRDHNAGDVPDHFSYYRKGHDGMGEVLATFEGLDLADGGDGAEGEEAAERSGSGGAT